MLLLLVAGAASAHTGEGINTGFASGFWHPILGWDHVVAMVAVGLWGAFLGGSAIWTLPVVFPLLTGLGFDPIWIGVVITIVIEIGQVTPPVGLNLSVLTALTDHEVPLGRVATATVPYWLIHLFAIGLITVFPALALFLPDLLF